MTVKVLQSQFLKMLPKQQL